MNLSELGRNLPRLFQPKNPIFWLMVALNVSSTAIMWVAQTQTHLLTHTGRVMLVLFALGNVYFGVRCALVLMREPPKK